MADEKNACLYCPDTYFSNIGTVSQKQYPSITFAEIKQLLGLPMHHAKADAPFFIPSSYLGHDGRSHEVQRHKGQFWYLTVDIDQNNLSSAAVETALAAVIGDAHYLMHSTSSARIDHRKWRILVPLANHIPGADFEETQDAFFDLLEAENTEIVCDRALARTGQAIYLPNVPPENCDEEGHPLFYEHFIVGDEFLHLDDDHPILVHRGKARQQVLLQQAEVEADRGARDLERGSSASKHGGTSPIEAFNATRKIASLLAKYGYDLGRSRDTWRSPHQTSTSFAVKDFGTHWVSHSESDRKAGVGKAKTVEHATATGRLLKRSGSYCWGDAFDLFVHYEHGGDFDAAMKAAVKAKRKAEISNLNISSLRDHRLTEAEESVCDEQDAVILDTTSSLIENNLNAGDDAISLPEESLSPIDAAGAIGDAPSDLSDDQLALELGLAGFDVDARFVKPWGKWIFWNGSVWEVDEKNSSMTLVRKFLRTKAAALVNQAELRAENAATDDEKKTAKKKLNWAKNESTKLRNSRTVAAVHGLAASNPGAAVSTDQFDAEPYLLATPGGTVDLGTGDLRPARREDYLTKQVAVAPVQTAAEPQRWLKFLDRIFDGDQELISFLQRAAGYALTGSNEEHKLLFFYGTGRNGKSVFLNTLMGLWGPLARRAAASIFLDKAHEGHPTEIAGLRGARLVVGSELPPGKSWNEATIKDLTGGDKLTARLMRQDFFDFTPQFTLMIAGNNQPTIRDVDEAMRARLCLVPFEVTIPEEERDPELETKLQAEWPSILRWCIEGCLQWQNQGLNPPAKVIAASEEYLQGEDLIGRYLEERTVVNPNQNVSNQELRSDFSAWTAKQGIREWSQSALTKAIKKTGRFETYKSGDVRGFRGMRLSKSDQMAELRLVAQNV